MIAKLFFFVQVGKTHPAETPRQISRGNEQYAHAHVEKIADGSHENERSHDSLKKEKEKIRSVRRKIVIFIYMNMRMCTT